MKPTRYGYAIALLLCGLLGEPAFGNGINPPRPSGSQTIEARCTDRDSGETTTLQRARLAADEASPMIELRIGNAAASTLQLAQVAAIRMPSAKAKPDGFAKATLELRNPDYQGPGFVRVRVDGKPVQLTGFTEARARVTIPLESCKALTLSASTAPLEDGRGVPKK
ncbi:MAG: hypothetical protein JSR69_05335 [Proteobacteria bacterium]|nr:hypothetical protein [Pseudomonadota bacterium]